MAGCSGGLYVFQGNSLVFPADASGPAVQKGISPEAAAAFAGIKGADSFAIPSLDGSGDIPGITLPESFKPDSRWKALPLRQVLDLSACGTIDGGPGDTGRLIRSYHISLWRKESRFCGSCGSPNKDADTGELARLCPACGRMEFPRIAPAVITIIINDNGEALLAHNKKFVPGVYSLIAGFNEAGESLEATVVREIREEVGIEVKDVRYIRSQPWPFPNSLMLGFTARYAGGVVRPDGVEIEDAGWFSRKELPLLPGNGSVSRYLIGLWIEGKIACP
ncbi:MAG: NAD(+) diphosphatase [Treponema sp.]|nr:NAD(+) diphosphatase [Treponema sp.]